MAQTTIKSIVLVHTEDIPAGSPALVTSVTNEGTNSTIGAHVFADGEAASIAALVPSEDDSLRPSLYPYWS
jgi:hypothetical protein